MLFQVCLIIVLFPWFFGLLTGLMKLRTHIKATRGWWLHDLRLEPRDLWLGVFWDDTRPGGFHIFVVLIPGVVWHATRAPLALVSPGDAGRTPGESAEPLTAPDGGYDCISGHCEGCPFCEHPLGNPCCECGAQPGEDCREDCSVGAKHGGNA